MWPVSTEQAMGTFMLVKGMTNNRRENKSLGGSGMSNCVEGNPNPSTTSYLRFYDVYRKKECVPQIHVVVHRETILPYDSTQPRQVYIEHMCRDEGIKNKNIQKTRF